MTTTITATGLDVHTAAAVGAIPVAAPASPPTDHPGRWLGGVLGAVVPAVFAAMAIATGDEPAVTIDSIFAFDGIAAVSLAGIPVGFMVGRALLPFVRSGGRRNVLGAGLAAGLLAPPVGAIGVLFGQALSESLARSEDPWFFVAYLVLVPLALVFGYVAVVVTLPAGMVWALLARGIPASWFERLRMPPPIDRLGVGHLVAALLAFLIGSELVRTFTDGGIQ